MSPGSVKAMYGKHCRPRHLWIFLFTFITFTCASLETERPSERVTAFHLHIETPEEVVVLLSVLYHFYCKVTLQLSLSTKADTSTHTHAHTPSPSGMLVPRGARYDLALLSCWPWRERITSVGKQAVHLCVCLCVCVCVCVRALYTNVWWWWEQEGGCTSFELRALSRDKLLRHHKATWSISLFSSCQDHFMWWWFDAWAPGLLLPLSDWAMIVRAGIAGITELLGSNVSLSCERTLTNLLPSEFRDPSGLHNFTQTLIFSNAITSTFSSAADDLKKNKNGQWFWAFHFQNDEANFFSLNTCGMSQYEKHRCNLIKGQLTIICFNYRVMSQTLSLCHTAIVYWETWI